MFVLSICLSIYLFLRYMSVKRHHCWFTAVVIALINICRNDRLSWRYLRRPVHVGLLSFKHSMWPCVNERAPSSRERRTHNGHLVSPFRRAPEVQGRFTVLAREIILLRETSTSPWWWEAGSTSRWAQVGRVDETESSARSRQIVFTSSPVYFYQPSHKKLVESHSFCCKTESLDKLLFIAASAVY